MIYWIFKATVLRALRWWFRPQLEGPLPSFDEPVLLVANHQSFIDSFFVGAIIPRRVTFLAKASYFNTPGLLGYLMRGFFRSLGQIPIDRRGGRASKQALDAGLDVLRRGGVLAMYPEGTRSPDGRLYRGRTGVARIAIAAKVRVVPLALIGTDRIQPPGTVIPRSGPLRIRIGAPLDFSHYQSPGTDGAVLRAITDEIMRQLCVLSGQDYVDNYSPGWRSGRAHGAPVPSLAADAETE
jgi:1-acyl-sn-glycerol-3-phosphate acyltransferase